MKSHSEAGQDLWVLEILGNQRNGFFVDAGAHDGEKCSNTLLLEKEFGWAGVCIEADPANFTALMEKRSCLCVNACLHPLREMVRFFDFGLTGSVVDDGRDIGREAQGVPLEDVLDSVGSPPVIDYLSMDIEGHEHAVLENFPFDRYAFRTITIEHNDYSVGPGPKLRLRGLLFRHGYLLSRGDVTTPQGGSYEDWFIKPRCGSKAPTPRGA